MTLETPVDDPVEIHDRPDRGRYEASIDGAVAGFVQYRLEGDRITFIHTEADPAFKGSHVGTKLARFVLDDARARGLKVRPDCPFIRRYIARHPDDQDLVV